MSEVNEGRKAFKVIAKDTEGIVHEIMVFSEDMDYAKQRVEGLADIVDNLPLTVTEIKEVDVTV